jgi:drug/metabolite transporter (DMT)-like permease
MDTTLTLAALFTAAGAVAAAAVIRQLIELLKAAFPMLSARVSGAIQAFVAAALLYLLAFLAVGPFTPEGVFAAFLAWLGCAVGAVGINAAVEHVAAVRAAPAFPSTEATTLP